MRCIQASHFYFDCFRLTKSKRSQPLSLTVVCFSTIVVSNAYVILSSELVWIFVVKLCQYSYNCLSISFGMHDAREHLSDAVRSHAYVATVWLCKSLQFWAWFHLRVKWIKNITITKLSPVYSIHSVSWNLLAYSLTCYSNFVSLLHFKSSTFRLFLLFASYFSSNGILAFNSHSLSTNCDLFSNRKNAHLFDALARRTARLVKSVTRTLSALDEIR